MARIRSIKPEFWSDDSVIDCSPLARLMFIGTWNFADDAGNLDRSAKQLKTRIFPVDNIDCEPLVIELLAHGLLIEYSVSGKKYLHIPGFADHQIINRPSKPVVPTYHDSLRTHGTLSEPSVSTHDGGEGRDRKGEERSGREGKQRQVAQAVDKSHANGQVNGSGDGRGEDSGGQSFPPEEPSPQKRGVAAERRNGSFEEINDAIEKLVTDWKIPASETGRLAQMAQVSRDQVEVALQQLRDRGRLPAAVAA